MNTLLQRDSAIQTFIPSVISRFWEKVEVKSESECWNWTAAIGSHGYGVFRVTPKNFTAHRFSFLVTTGSIPDGLCVLHRCDNRKCVNPKHFFLGTREDNLVDMRLKGRAVSSDVLSAKCRGEKHSRLKLSEDKVREIRVRGGNGESQTSIAKLFGVSTTTVWKILNKQIWGFVV